MLTLPRLLIASASGFLVCTGLLSFINRRSGRFLALVWIALGTGIALAALKPEVFGDSAPGTYVVRIRLVMGLLSFAVLMITLETVRRLAMQERYAILWVSTGLSLVVLAVYPNMVGWLSTITGMTYISAIMVVVFAFLLLVSFHFSLALSHLREDQKRLAQRTAIVELRVRELEQKLRDSEAGRQTSGNTSRNT